MENIIQVDKLSKEFNIRKHHQGKGAWWKNFITQEHRVIKAVDSVSFSLKAGEFVGYLGPNGAGKSTTIKMLTGLLVPSDGEMQINGYLPWKDRQKYVKDIGAVFGQRTTLWWDLPVIESLSLLKHIYEIPADRFNQNLKEFEQLLDLSSFLDTPVRSLSLGQRMRADICAALLHNPKLLFLDEPTIGLDVVAKENIRQFLLHINQERGTTIILTTHDLSDVEKLCKRVLLIDEGKLVYDDQLKKLKETYGGKRQLIIDFVDAPDNLEASPANIVSREGNRITFQFSRGEITASDLIAKIIQNHSVRDLEVREPQIEETIRNIYQNQMLK